MNDNDLVRLQHILDYAREARYIASKHKRTDLYSDRILMHALVRLVEVIGEAAANVSQETQTQLPQIKWKAIIGMRNKLIHAYNKIDLYILWNTVIYDLPKLVEECLLRRL